MREAIRCIINGRLTRHRTNQSTYLLPPSVTQNHKLDGIVNVRLSECDHQSSVRVNQVTRIARGKFADRPTYFLTFMALPMALPQAFAGNRFL